MRDYGSRIFKKVAEDRLYDLLKMSNCNEINRLIMTNNLCMVKTGHQVGKNRTFRSQSIWAPIISFGQIVQNNLGGKRVHLKGQNRCEKTYSHFGRNSCTNRVQTVYEPCTNPLYKIEFFCVRFVQETDGLFFHNLGNLELQIEPGSEMFFPVSFLLGRNFSPFLVSLEISSRAICLAGVFTVTNFPGVVLGQIVLAPVIFSISIFTRTIFSLFLWLCLFLYLYQILDSIFKFIVKEVGIDLSGANLTVAEGLGGQNQVSGLAIEIGGKGVSQGVDGEFTVVAIIGNACPMEPLCEASLHLAGGNPGSAVGDKKRLSRLAGLAGLAGLTSLAALAVSDNDTTIIIPSLPEPGFQKAAEFTVDKPALFSSSLCLDIYFFVIQPYIANVEANKFGQPNASTQKEFDDNQVPLSGFTSLLADGPNKFFSLLWGQIDGGFFLGPFYGKALGRVFGQNIFVLQVAAKGAQDGFGSRYRDLAAVLAVIRLGGQVGDDIPVYNIAGKISDIQVAGKKMKPLQFPFVDIDGKRAFSLGGHAGKEVFDTLFDYHLIRSSSLLSFVFSFLVIVTLSVTLSFSHAHVCFHLIPSQDNCLILSILFAKTTGTKRGAGVFPAPRLITLKCSNSVSCSVISNSVVTLSPAVVTVGAAVSIVLLNCDCIFWLRLTDALLLLAALFARIILIVLILLSAVALVALIVLIILAAALSALLALPSITKPRLNQFHLLPGQWNLVNHSGLIGPNQKLPGHPADLQPGRFSHGATFYFGGPVAFKKAGDMGGQDFAHLLLLSQVANKMFQQSANGVYGGLFFALAFQVFKILGQCLGDGFRGCCFSNRGFNSCGFDGRFVHGSSPLLVRVLCHRRVHECFPFETSQVIKVEIANKF